MRILRICDKARALAQSLIVSPLQPIIRVLWQVYIYFNVCGYSKM